MKNKRCPFHFASSRSKSELSIFLAWLPVEIDYRSAGVDIFFFFAVVDRMKLTV